MSHGNPITRRSRLRTGALLLGLSLATAVQFANATVTVDQSPLTVEQTLAPNIVLMLDDSGSMGWNFMPDICYLNGVTCNSAKTSITGYTMASDNTNVALLDSTNNGVYYNPQHTYPLPIQVDGTSYPNSPGLTGAWVDGFNNATSATVNLTTYASAASNLSNYYYTGSYETYTDGSGAGTGYSNLPFSTTTSTTVTTTYAATGTTTNKTENNKTVKQCVNDYNSDQDANTDVSNCQWNGSACPVNPGNGSSQRTCTWTETNYNASSCTSGDTRSGGTCSHTVVTTYYYFQFSTGPAAGPYTRYFVAPTAQGCQAIPAGVTCVTEGDTSGAAAPIGVNAGQNIANWFSYYRTRLLSAKSGLTAAFNTLDPSVRFGFGSIDGDNDNALPTGQFTANSVTLAKVSPFDNSCVTSVVSPCAKGQSGTRRNAFWSWIAGESSGGGTNLRNALDMVGQYYSASGTNSAWKTSSADGTELACRQAYVIATTDGFWNDSFTLSGTANADGTNHAAITGVNSQTYTYTAHAPYSDSNSSTLSDVAMKYWVNDLRTDIANDVRTSTEDPAFWQHMVTFTVGLGFDPTGISPATYDHTPGSPPAGNGVNDPTATTIADIFSWANGGQAIPSFSWPTPASNSINNIADLAHAAVNGHGGFYSAGSPEAFAGGLSDALKRVVGRNGTGASLAANSTTLQAGTVAYQAFYFTSKWKGDLLAYAVDSTTGAIALNPSWTASMQLPTPASRNIITWPMSGSTIAFTSANVGSLSSAQQTALGANATARQNVINYLRGDSSLEQKNDGIYRDRDVAIAATNQVNSLGDIVDSTPVFVGAPNPNTFILKTFTGSDTYSAFAASQASRSPRIWVAANDGMLHAFDASTGAETFAYLPGSVILANVANLADPNYGGSLAHQFFNDGQLTVADVYLSGAWKTVLVGTTGRGPSKTVYALDITDPAAPTLLWERSAADGQTNSGYIGQIVGQPVIAQTADGTWSVLIGNGYNSTQDKAALLQFALSNGALSVHATNNSTSNGLASPAVWMSSVSNGISTTAYAGDLLGNVWSFDLSSSNSSGTLLYTAKDASANAQPITAGMLVGKDPDTGNLWLFFGTGKFLNTADLSTTTTQTWYGIIVSLGGAPAGEIAITSSSTRSALRQRSILTEAAATSTTLGSRTVSSPTTGDMSGKAGWYLDLLNPNGSPGPTAEGERIVAPNQFQGSLILATTRIPVAVDACNPNGRGWIMALDPFTGGNPAAVFFDLNGDRLFNDSDKVGGKASAGIGFTALPNSPIFVSNTMLTSFDNASHSSVATFSSGSLKRVSWREWIGQ